MTHRRWARASLGASLAFLALSTLGMDGGCTRPYPEPGAWPANQGPGLPAVSFDESALYEACAFLDGGPLDLFDHHNLVTMYDGYLLLPWAPEWGGGGLAFFDMSDPCAPERIGTSFSSQMRETHSIGFSSVGGRWAVTNYISNILVGGTGVQFWDVRNPRRPEVVGQLAMPGSFYPDSYARLTLSVFWQAPYVYVAGADNGIYVVDATDPTNPSLVTQYSFEPTMRAGQIQAVGNLLIVTAAEGARTVLLDISDPGAPRPIPGGDFLARDAEDNPRAAYFTNTANGYVYYARKDAGGGVIVYDIHDPTNPTRAGAYASNGNGGYVFPMDDYAFTGESNFTAIYDLSDLSDIREVARLAITEGDLDTMTPIGNLVVVSTDDGAEGTDRGSAIAPWRTEPDSIPPRVTWSWPAKGAAAVPLTSRIGLTFNEAVEVKSAWTGSVRLYETGTDPATTRVDGHISAQEAIVNFWPKRPLAPSTDYTLEVPAGGITDFTGNAIQQPFLMHFRTGGGGDVDAVAGASTTRALIGDEVVLDGSGSVGAALYQWDLGDGSPPTAPSADPTVTATYGAPGRYRAVLTVFDAQGDSSTAEVVITITAAPSHAPRHSGTLTAIPGAAPGTDRFAVVNEDAAELTILERDGGDAFSVVRRIDTAPGPRTVSVWGEWLVVPCAASDVVELVRHDGGAERHSVALPYGSAPFGAVGAGDALFVSLQATGEVAEIRFDTRAPSLVRTLEATPDARGVALLPDGRIAVSRWRSPDERAEVVAVNPANGSVDTLTLAFDPQISSDTEIGGVPSYLDQVLVSPTGDELALPSLQANISDGLFLNGRPQSFETVVRGVVSFVDWPSATEDFDRRTQFDNRGFSSAGVYNAFGDYLYLAMRGSRTVERLDVLGGDTQAGSILDVGFAVDGLALSADGRFLLAHASLSREVVVYDVSDFTIAPVPVARLSTQSAEALSPLVLRGKQLFNDAADPRLGKDSYLACAHCHLDTLDDHRVWDFTDRGEGLRNTISLAGRAGMGDGPVHWSANFDEIHDFEHDIRGPFQGTGLMTDAQFDAGTRSEPLGDPKAGVSADLDALAVYVASLTDEPRSPWRAADGSLTAAAERGRTIFFSELAGCASCHAGARLTDSAFVAPGVPVLHDVGTLGPGSGERLGGPLDGIDTPSLHGLFGSAPYLHDGSAADVKQVLTARNPTDLHGSTSHLTPAQLADLVAYLKSLDGSAP